MGEIFSREAALRYAGGDEELRREFLAAYAEEGEKHCAALAKAAAARCWRDYENEAHAVKSTSKTVGAMAFSEKAKEQEMLAKNGKAAEILASWQPFLEEYRAVLQAAKAEAACL